MTRSAWLTFTGLFVISAGVCLALAPLRSNPGFNDAVSVLSFVTVAAVAIERILELFWTLVSQQKGLGGWWPLAEVVKRASAIDDSTNLLLKDGFKMAASDLTTLKSTLGGAKDKIQAIDAQLASLDAAKADLTARWTAAQALAPGSARVAFATGVVSDAAGILSNAATKGHGAASALLNYVDNASKTVTIATNIVASFQDNPARRIASIVLGTSAGMVVTGMVGLNMFVAILDRESGVLAGNVGILVTGLVIGLGSNPTHELIKALQNYKTTRQSQTAASLPGADDSSGDALGVRQFSLRGPAVNLEDFIHLTTTAPIAQRRAGTVLLRSTD